MGDKDLFKDIFSEKLKDIELPVNEKLWSAISNQIPTVASTTGVSLISKIIIGSSISAATLVGGYFLYSSLDNKQNVIKSQNSVNKIEINNKIEKKEIVLSENNSSVTSIAEEKISTKENSLSNELSDEILQLDNSNNSSSVIVVNPSKVDVTPIVSDHSDNQQIIQVPTEKPKTNIIPSENNTASVEVKSDYTLDLKNVFTPNGDGVNDYLEIEVEGLLDFSVVILDKNNQKVYTSNDPHFKWDGSNMNGDLVPEGSYVYFITAKTENNKPVSKYSSLTIKR